MDSNQKGFSGGTGNTYRSDSEGDNVLLVTFLQVQQPAVLLVTLVPAVDYLVTPPGNVDTLAVTAGELLLPTPGKFERNVVELFFTTGRIVLLYHPAASPQHQRVERIFGDPYGFLLLTHNAFREGLI